MSTYLQDTDDSELRVVKVKMGELG